MSDESNGELIMKLFEEILVQTEELADANFRVDEYKKKYKTIVVPEFVRSWIEQMEEQCGSDFPYDKTKYYKLHKHEKKRKIREDRWIFMLANKASDPSLRPLLDRLDDSKVQQFCEDVSTVYDFIIDEIHHSNFDDPEEPPKEYYYLYFKPWKYVTDIVLSIINFDDRLSEYFLQKFDSVEMVEECENIPVE